MTRLEQDIYGSSAPDRNYYREPISGLLEKVIASKKWPIMIGELNGLVIQDAFGLNPQALRHLGTVTRVHGIVEVIPVRVKGRTHYAYDKNRIRALFHVGRALARKRVNPSDFYTDDSVQQTIVEQVQKDEDIDPLIRALVHPPAPIREVRRAIKAARRAAVVYHNVKYPF